MTKLKKYIDEDQRNVVFDIVRYLLNFSHANNRLISQETLHIAIAEYADLVDAPSTPGADTRYD